MSGRHSFRELTMDFTPERRRRIDDMKRELLAEMPLHELLAFMGHALRENGNGLLMDFVVSGATGTAEREKGVARRNAIARVACVHGTRAQGEWQRSADGLCGERRDGHGGA